MQADRSARERFIEWAAGSLSRALVLLATLALSTGVAAAESRYITLASTTSTDNSGLLAYLAPLFEAKSGIKVRVVAVGTGQALRLGRNGDADVLLVHAKAAEEKFVAEGYGEKRYDVMYNDFVIVGPVRDAAGVRGMKDAPAALSRIAQHASPFLSRGDDSGTHKAELRLWAASGVDPSEASGTWYRETGSGMGATLNTGAAMDAYALTDRGTWLSFRNRATLVVLVEEDPRLFNPYGAILVSPLRHPHVKAEEGRAFIEWLVSPEGQKAIADFRVGREPLFHPNARTAAPPGG